MALGVLLHWKKPKDFDNRYHIRFMEMGTALLNRKQRKENKLYKASAGSHKSRKLPILA